MRQKRKIYQEDLAEKVGVDTTTLRNWEKGRSGQDMFVRVAKLCEALNCSPNELFEE